MATVTRTIAACVFLLLQSGCAAFGGDLIVRVSGSVPEPHGDDGGRQCQLNMHDGSGDAVAAMPVGSHFSVPMMVVAGPEPKQYRFTVECADGRRFESAAVPISSRRVSPRKIDLGELHSR